MRLCGMGLFLLAASCGSDPQSTVLQPQDLKQASEAPFTQNNIIDDNAFEVSEGVLDVRSISAQVGEFLARTPYGRPTFLQTYSSNGLSAADAIARASVTYKLSWQVLLVKIQAVQGLIGERFYPANSQRVEYVFRCGCNGQGACDASYAGLDKQVACFSRSLRQSLDEMAAKGVTSGGWGKDVDALTIDGIKVRPENKATAALYQYEPVVGVGERGSWLFWNIFTLYSANDFSGGL